MNLVREHIIFEKFVEDSDPVYDMKIGIINLLNKEIQELLEKYPISNLLDSITISGKGRFVIIKIGGYVLSGVGVIKKELNNIISKTTTLNECLLINTRKVYSTSVFSSLEHIIRVKRKYWNLFEQLNKEFKRKY
jgi:hypothetical protein